MLARRLLVFAMVLLVVTAISTVLAPPQRPATEADTAEPESSAPSAEAATATRRFDARDEPRTIRVDEGTLLTVTVRADEPGAVELEGLGQLSAVDPSFPVAFTVLASEPDDYPVLLRGNDTVRTIGTLRVVSDE